MSASSAQSLLIRPQPKRSLEHMSSVPAPWETKRAADRWERYDANLELFRQVYRRERIGMTLRSIRETRGLTQENLAFVCQTDKGYISSVERGKTNVSLAKLTAILAALSMKLSDFCLLIESRTP